MRREVLWVVTGSIAVGLAVAGYWVFFSDSMHPTAGLDAWSTARAEAKEDYSVVPSPVKQEETVDYLTQRATPLLALHAVAVSRVGASASDVNGCRRDVDRLNREVPQNVAVDLIIGIPDEPLRAYLEDERAMLAIVLAECLNPAAQSPVANPADSFSRATGFADVRLDALGVPR